MINASQAFKQKLLDDERAYLEKVDITLANNTVLHLTNSDFWSGSLVFEDSVGSDSSFSALGSCIINSLKFTLNNIYDDFSDIDFTDATAIAYVGLDIEGTPEWLRKGTYTVSETTYNGSTITLKLLDNMSKFDRPYSDSTLIYSATLDTIVQNLCTVCGVNLASSSLNFPRKDYVIQTRPSDKATTCREVLSWCATIAGCFARCDRFGELELRWFDQNNMHELSSLYSQNISVDDVVITQIQAEVKAPSEDASESIQTYTSGTAGYAIKIAKNDFLTPTNAQAIVNELGLALIGLTFRKANISHSSDPTIEAGDCGTVIDRRENEYPILITRTNFKVGSSQTTVCGAETPARNSAARYTEATKSYVELRERIKKVDNPYAQAMSDLASAIYSASGMYKTEVQQPGGGVITYWHNKPVLAESDIQIMISDVGMTFTNTGTSPSPTWYGYTMDGDILGSVLTVVGINADWINTGQLVVKDANQNETFFADTQTGVVRINATNLSINSNPITDLIDDAEKVATNYLSYNAIDGLTLGYTGQSERVVVTYDGMEIYDGQDDQIAQFKAVTRLGHEDSGNLKMDYHSLQLQDVDGNTYVHFSDLRNQDKYAIIEEEGSLVYSAQSFLLKYWVDDVSDVLEVKVNGTKTTAFTLDNSYTYARIRFNSNVPANTPVYVKYKTPDAITAYTLGIRDDGEIGNGSFVSGYYCVANGKSSHAEGYECIAKQSYDHAEGRECIAGEDYATFSSADGYHASHAEGYYCEAKRYGSHAEGYQTITNHACSHAEGRGSQTNGRYSHAEGYYTIANNPDADANSSATNVKSQHVSGQYNIETPNYIFVIGGGSSDNDRKNIFTLDLSGNTTITGTLTQSSDKRLKLHHAYLSDQEQDVNNFIESLKPAYFEKDQAKHLGFYAQDVQLSDKWNTMVSEDTNGYLALGYTEIIAPLVAYVQNQQKKIDSLEERIARLEQLINQQ